VAFGNKDVYIVSEIPNKNMIHGFQISRKENLG
jgi:hypothetical protein